MPQLSRFPAKKEESETICLARRGRQAREARWKKKPAWGSAILQQAAEGDECPATCPHCQAARQRRAGVTDAAGAIPPAAFSALGATRRGDGCGGTEIRLAGCERSQHFCLMPSIRDGGDRY